MRILLTRLSSLGDIVHTWPLADSLAARDDVELAWLVEEPYLPLVERRSGVAHAIAVATRRWRRAPFAPRTWREIRATTRRLRAFAPELSVDPQGLVKSAIWPASAGVGRRVGLARGARRESAAGLFYTETIDVPVGRRHVVDRNLALARAAGADDTPGAIPDAGPLGDGAAPSWLPAGAVALLPATAGGGKAWPGRCFAALACRLLAQGRRPVLLWGPGEEELARGIAAGAAGALVAPPTTISSLAAALRHCSAAIGGDTGPVHLAAALKVPTVAVFVASDPERNGPRGERVRVLSGAAAGAGGGRARTRRERDVTVEDVEAAVEELLSQR